MNNRIKRIISILGIIIFLIVLAALLIYLLLFNSKAPATKILLDDPLKMYNTAIAEINTKSHSYHVEVQKESSIDEELFREIRNQRIIKNNITDSEFTIAVDEQLSIGEHTAAITEIYHDGTVYITVENGKFRAAADSKEFETRYTPLVIIDPSLYESVSGYAKNEQSYIEFSKPQSPEKWAWDDNYAFDTAEGYAVLSKNGSLLSSTYVVSYFMNKTKIKLTITTKPEATNKSIAIPDDLTSYTEISNPDAPRLLEKACGYLMEAASIHSVYEDYIECTAFEDRQSRRIQIDAIKSPDWASRTHTTLTYLDHSKAGSDSVIEKEEVFINGNYTIRIDNTEPVSKDSVTEESIRTECLNTIVGTIMLPEQIADVTISESETTYDIVYNANAAFSEQMRANACETLYQNPDILSDQTESYTVDMALCYLRLDKATGLPVASGFRYIGTYTMDALPYRLEFRADQQYEILNDTAKETINAVVVS